MTVYTIGYARTSTRQQDLTLQRIALEKAGCNVIIEEQESGAKRDRPKLAEALAQLRPGDVFVVWKIDRLARSLSHLLAIVEDLQARGIHFKSVTEQFDTTTAAGEAFFQICGVMAQLERKLIEERREEGLKKARASGVKFGRKRLDSGDLAKALRAIERCEMSVTRAAKTYGIARSTLNRHLTDFRAEDSLQPVSNIVSLPLPATDKGPDRRETCTHRI